MEAFLSRRTIGTFLVSGMFLILMSSCVSPRYKVCASNENTPTTGEGWLKYKFVVDDYRISATFPPKGCEGTHTRSSLYTSEMRDNNILVSMTYDFDPYSREDYNIFLGITEEPGLTGKTAVVTGSRTFQTSNGLLWRHLTFVHRQGGGSIFKSNLDDRYYFYLTLVLQPRMLQNKSVVQSKTVLAKKILESISIRETNG